MRFGRQLFEMRRSSGRTQGVPGSVGGGGGEGLQDYPEAPSAYYNSREPGTGPGTGTEFAEDFGRRPGASPLLDGAWYTAACGGDPFTSDKGWCGDTSFGSIINRGITAPASHPFGTYCGTSTVRNAAYIGLYRCTTSPDPSDCLTNSAAEGCCNENSPDAGDNLWDGQSNIHMADKSLSSGTVTHLYVRWYEWVSSDHGWGQLKAVTFNKQAGFGGIRFFNIGYGAIGAGSINYTSPNIQIYDQFADRVLSLTNMSAFNMATNKGSNWMCMQAEVKMNTVGNSDGVVRFWADHCGTDGIPLVTGGVSGTPTLRGQHTDINIRNQYGGNDTDNFGDVWFEDWSNECVCSVGERRWDMMWCMNGSTRGDNNPIPFCAPFSL